MTLSCPRRDQFAGNDVGAISVEVISDSMARR
jgi:hypothetical protein